MIKYICVASERSLNILTTELNVDASSSRASLVAQVTGYASVVKIALKRFNTPFSKFGMGSGPVISRSFTVTENTPDRMPVAAPT